MLKYYTNKTLSSSLGTNLAKWKRWSREFLPPDPLGGMQSGYARQYTPDEAFTVYLGGHLVADLHFTIPAVRQILTDLAEWLAENGFAYETGAIAETPGQPALPDVTDHMIYVTPVRSNDTPDGGQSGGFHYLIREILSTEPAVRDGMKIQVEHLVETSLPASASRTMALSEMNPVALLNITAVLKRFVHCLDLEPSRYRKLS